MKKVLVICIGVASLFSCKKKEEISACMTADKTEILVNEVVQFENCSENYLTAEWDFGDGIQSEVANTSHRFEEPGEYVVRLRVIDDKGNTSESSTIIKVYEVKLAKITIDHPNLTDQNTYWNISYNFSSLLNNPQLTMDTLAPSKIEFVYKNTQPIYNQDITLSGSAYEVDWWNWNLIFESDLVINAYDEVTLEKTSITKYDADNEFTATFNYELEL